MKIILSRKGFDSSSGGKPSPVLPDGRMVSLPIPDKQSQIRYQDIRWQEYNLGTLVSDLTDGRIPESHNAHLDPDLSYNSLPRHKDWRPVFGQTGAAQGHLRKKGVGVGDIFLFFGLFRNVISVDSKLVWDINTPLRHMFWGWLQVGEVVNVDECNISKYEWAKYHPHFQRKSDANNTLYISSKYLTPPGVSSGELAGAGVFPRVLKQFMLTSPDASTPSQWELPQWFYPRDGNCPLTYHSKSSRWQRVGHSTRLNPVARGQEFILDTDTYPESIEWINIILAITN